MSSQVPVRVASLERGAKFAEVEPKSSPFLAGLQRALLPLGVRVPANHLEQNFYKICFPVKIVPSEYIAQELLE